MFGGGSSPTHSDAEPFQILAQVSPRHGLRYLQVMRVGQLLLSAISDICAVLFFISRLYFGELLCVFLVRAVLLKIWYEIND